MELIANLEQARVKEGLTTNNLKHLERVFKETAGDKKEIDLNGFKKIVQSKNMFFVERIFKIFDVDNSGTVSLEEFMRVMWYFSRQTPVEKLRYLFEVYDLNDDGTIQYSELRNVISECMKENSLVFTEAEIDELTHMLFEDADRDGSGSITFNEFKDQLQRYPAFMENLTLSIERWLLPPKKPLGRFQLLQKWRPRKLQWNHIRNNWTSVTFLFVFFLINLCLFVSRAFQYSENNVYVIVARACGQCLNFTCSFILVLVLRQSLTWLRTHGLAQYLPIDQHLYYHKLTGCLILVYSLVHTFMHIGNFALISQRDNIPMERLLLSLDLGIGWVGGSACLTGWILLFLLTVILLSALPAVRHSEKFEVFYFLHTLSLVFWICLVIHGPNFWKWFLGPAVLFLIELAIRINRNLSSSKKAYVQQGILLPSKVTHLVIKRPPKFDFRPGDYVYINIPSIARYEWHPFTISSAPELDGVIWLHIRGVGEWTNSLNRFFQKKDKEAILSDELVKDLEVVSHPLAARSHPQCSTPQDLYSVASSAMHMKKSVARSYSEATAYRNPHNNTFSLKSPPYSTRPVDSQKYYKESSFNSTQLKSPYDNKSMVLSPLSEQGTFCEVLLNKNTPRRTSFTSTSTSRAVIKKNAEDARSIIAEHHKSLGYVQEKELSRGRDLLKLPSGSSFSKTKRKSVRVSVADRGLRRCQTVIVMPTLAEDDEDDVADKDIDAISKTEEEAKHLEREVEVENVVVAHQPLKIFLDGPYGSPTRHIFQARHAVMIATGIGVTPFASILQSIMYQYRKSRHTCPNCDHRWSDPLPDSSIHLRKVDFFWLNRHQRAFEWFVTLLSELEIEQAQLQERDRFLDIHMYITSALDKTDMKAVGLQMALDLLYQKEKRCLITGLKSRTQPGRPDWNKVFLSLANQKKGKVTVFFCGPNQLARTLQSKCDEFGFRFRKEIF